MALAITERSRSYSLWRALRIGWERRGERREEPGERVGKESGEGGEHPREQLGERPIEAGERSIEDPGERLRKRFQRAP